MDDVLFTQLTELMGGAFWLAIVGAFLWGILSVVLSPCHLTSIPLVVGYISQKGVKSTKAAFKVALAFSTGILITIALIGVITALLGGMMGDIGSWSVYAVAGVFILVGVYMLGLIPFDFPGMGQVKTKGKGIWPAFVLGAIFGIALGPCTFAFMAPILAITLFTPDTGFLHDFILLSSYGVGHCLVIVLAGTFTEIISRYLKWNERSKGALILKKLCGILIIIGGILLIYMH